MRIGKTVPRMKKAKFTHDNRTYEEEVLTEVEEYLQDDNEKEKEEEEENKEERKEENKKINQGVVPFEFEFNESNNFEKTSKENEFVFSFSSEENSSSIQAEDELKNETKKEIVKDTIKDNEDENDSSQHQLKVALEETIIDDKLKNNNNIDKEIHTFYTREYDTLTTLPEDITLKFTIEEDNYNNNNNREEEEKNKETNRYYLFNSVSEEEKKQDTTQENILFTIEEEEKKEEKEEKKKNRKVKYDNDLKSNIITIGSGIQPGPGLQLDGGLQIDNGIEIAPNVFNNTKEYDMKQLETKLKNRYGNLIENLVDVNIKLRKNNENIHGLRRTVVAIGFVLLLSIVVSSGIVIDLQLSCLSNNNFLS